MQKQNALGKRSPYRGSASQTRPRKKQRLSPMNHSQVVSRKRRKDAERSRKNHNSKSKQLRRRSSSQGMVYRMTDHRNHKKTAKSQKKTKPKKKQRRESVQGVQRGISRTQTLNRANLVHLDNTQSQIGFNLESDEASSDVLSPDNPVMSQPSQQTQPLEPSQSTAGTLTASAPSLIGTQVTQRSIILSNTQEKGNNASQDGNQLILSFDDELGRLFEGSGGNRDEEEMEDNDDVVSLNGNRNGSGTLSNLTRRVGFFEIESEDDGEDDLKAMEPPHSEPFRDLSRNRSRNHNHNHSERNSSNSSRRKPPVIWTLDDDPLPFNPDSVCRDKLSLDELKEKYANDDDLDILPSNKQQDKRERVLSNFKGFEDVEAFRFQQFQFQNRRSSRIQNELQFVIGGEHKNHWTLSFHDKVGDAFVQEKGEICKLIRGHFGKDYTKSLNDGIEGYPMHFGTILDHKKKVIAVIVWYEMPLKRMWMIHTLLVHPKCRRIGMGSLLVLGLQYKLDQANLCRFGCPFKLRAKVLNEAKDFWDNPRLQMSSIDSMRRYQAEVGSRSKHNMDISEYFYRPQNIKAYQVFLRLLQRFWREPPHLWSRKENNRRAMRQRH